MPKVVVQANEIRTNDGERIEIDNVAAYRDFYSIDELSDQDLITKYHLINAVTPTTPPLQLILAAGQNVPVIYTPVPVAYEAAVQVTVENKADGRLIWDADIRIIRDGISGLITSIQLYGHPDGGTPLKNLDDMVIIISKA